MKQKFFALLTVVLVTGCTTTGGELGDQFAGKIEAKTGVVFMSLTHQEGVFNSYPPHCDYISADGGTKGNTISYLNQISLNHDKTVIFSKVTKNAFGKPAIMGRLVSLRLPAGKYKFTACNSETVFVRSKTIEPINIRFEVSNGEMTYLGNLETGVFDKVMSFRLLSNKDRDMAIIKSLYPKIDLATIKEDSFKIE